VRVRLLDLGVALVPEDLARSSITSYTIGVGEDIDFERRLASLGEARQWLFDPTPRAVAFMGEPGNGLPRAQFLPLGIWERDQKMWFNAPANDGQVSHSITEASSSDAGFEAECRSPRSVMTMLGHDRVDLVKMNIEGAEDVVLRSMLDAGIHPRCIICTWEGRGALHKALAWTRLLRAKGWNLCGRKGWYFTYLRAS
jgi:FkbM family methyltransferase